MPSLSAVISWCRWIASVQLNTETSVVTGFSSVGNAAVAIEYAASRPPVPPPGTPICPISAASVNTARAEFSPFECRCGPQPWLMLHGFADAISRARRVIVPAGTPVIAAAHSGVLAVPSGPRPST